MKLFCSLLLAAFALCGQSRPLTPGEISLSKSIFGSKIDCLKTSILNHSWIIQGKRTAVSPNGNIYMRGDGVYGIYRNDFSAESSPYQKAIFIHELVHVWQYQSGVWIKSRRIFDRKYEYDFSKLGNTDFKKYGLEQQASIVEHYFILRCGRAILDRDHRRVKNPPSIQTYQRVLSTYFPEIAKFNKMEELSQS